MKAVILCVALGLLSAPTLLQAHDGREEERSQWGERSHARGQDGDRHRDRYDGMHYGRYRPFYFHPLRDCPDEPRRYNRRTGRMEPSCEVPRVRD